jgi:hypothetical protein
VTSQDTNTRVWAAEPGFALWAARERGHSGEWRARLADVLEGVGGVAATPGGVGPGRSGGDR